MRGGVKGSWDISVHFFVPSYQLIITSKYVLKNESDASPSPLKKIQFNS